MTPSPGQVSKGSSQGQGKLEHQEEEKSCTGHPGTHGTKAEGGVIVVPGYGALLQGQPAFQRPQGPGTGHRQRPTAALLPGPRTERDWGRIRFTPYPPFFGPISEEIPRVQDPDHLCLRCSGGKHGAENPDLLFRLGPEHNGIGRGQEEDQSQGSAERLRPPAGLDHESVIPSMASEGRCLVRRLGFEPAEGGPSQTENGLYRMR